MVLGGGNDRTYQAGWERLWRVPDALEESFDERQLVGVVVDCEPAGKAEQFGFAPENAC